MFSADAKNLHGRRDADDAVIIEGGALRRARFVIVSLILTLQLGIAVDRPNTDRWLATDKLEHYAASAVIEGTMFSALRSRHVSKGRSLVAATAVTIAAGVGKEMLDRHRGYAFSTKDLAWDFAGMSSVFGLLRRGNASRYVITPQIRVDMLSKARAAGR